MNERNFCSVVVVYIVVLFGTIGFSTPSQMDKAEFSPKNCTSDDQCQSVCVTGEYLFNRCDPNGVCICDCSDPSELPSGAGYTTACEGKQPDGYWRDFCDAYCTQEYRRPCRYCTESNKEHAYCTCVCHI